MSSQLSWMLNEKILPLECEGQIDSPVINSTHAEISQMLGQTAEQQAYLLFDISNSSDSKDYEYSLLSQLDASQIKAVILISNSPASYQHLSQRIEQEAAHRPMPKVLLGSDREIAFNYLSQIVDKRSTRIS